MGANQFDDLNIGADRQQRDQKIGLWLLVGQFLTVASILLIVSMNDLETPSGLSLKILGIGASLIGVGIVFIFRRFRLRSVRPVKRELTTPEPTGKSSEVVPSPTVTVDATHRSSPNLASQAGQGRNRRTDLRSRVNHPTLLISQGAGAAGVRVLDVSATGMRVSVPFRLELNTEVEIQVNGNSISGVVRNCVCKAGTEFHVGVEINEAGSDGAPSFDQVLRRICTGGPVGIRK